MQGKMEKTAPSKDRWIPWLLVAFFAVIAVIDGSFVYIAVSTQTGVVTERAYEKGLAYDEILNSARSQPDIVQKASYENGILRWKLEDHKGAPITGAAVTAHIMRPVQDGHDFDIRLEEKAAGLYEAKVNPPLPGLWSAGLSSIWNNLQYRTSLEFISR